MQKTTSRQLVNRQLEAFQANWGKVGLAYAKSKNLTPYDVLIIASIVEKEVIAPEERPLVAAVIYNRLHDGMNLGIDATHTLRIERSRDRAASRVAAAEHEPVQHEKSEHQGTAADTDFEPRARLDAGGGAPGEGRLPLFRAQAGQRPPFLHRQRARVSELRERPRLRVITGRTTLVALLGHPVSGSLSPQMQNAAFAERGLDWAYVACDVAPELFETAVRGLAASGFTGANVTTPHKEAAAALAETELDSVNTLVFDGGRILGHSTDAAVLVGMKAEHPAIVGAGGAALAFRVALPGARVFSRTADWPPEIDDADLIVNATSERDEVLVEAGKGQTLVDLPYPETATATAARDAGAEVISGLQVLVAQGAASFELWTGVAAPVEVMRLAVGLSA